jgi:thiol-disulfide isomerase/thioredoxin
MKTLTLVVLVTLFIAGCAGTSVQKQEVIERGWLDRSVFQKPELHQFIVRYDTVALDRNLVDLICRMKEGVDALIFFGTWCGDSRREVPHFLKIADTCGWTSDHIKLYGLDRTKKSPDGLAEKYQIEKVPTLIFLKEGNEIGRMTEKPNGTLEADLLALLAAAQQH